MSEYQYYEFRAVDSPLTQRQMEELRAYSSRAEISPDSFVNEYNWGNFKGDPDKWMEKYFDAFLYLANWGTRILMLRVPKRLVDPAAAEKYCTDYGIGCRTKGDHFILSFQSEEEDSEWTDGEGWLAFLLPLRTALMREDYRCLYIGWLLAVQAGEVDDETLEPPLPSGLGALDAPLKRLVDFLRIDSDLITAAAEKSGNEQDSRLSAEDISKWLSKLPSKEKDAVIVRLLEGDDTHVAAELRNRALKEIRGAGKSGRDGRTSGLRSVGQLLARRDAIEEQRQRQKEERQVRENAERERAAAEQRRKRLEALDGKESSVWKQVEALIATKQPKRYDEAVSLLKDLNDLAEMKGSRSEFLQHMAALRSEHSKKPSFIDRLRTASLSQ